MPTVPTPDPRPPPGAAPDRPAPAGSAGPGRRPDARTTDDGCPEAAPGGDPPSVLDRLVGWAKLLTAIGLALGGLAKLLEVLG